MVWNWQLPDWPQFVYDSAGLASYERNFFKGAGGLFATLKTLSGSERKQFVIEILATEGMKSAEVEGEILQRESLQSSIQRHFGLSSDAEISPKELGMGELMWKMYDTFSEELTHEMLFNWHEVLFQNGGNLVDRGRYRTHKGPMQIVSGRLDRQTIFFEAPPSDRVHEEMSRFIQWFNESSENGATVERAAVAHVYFESIHPFEDGNGRIGRVLVEKALSQALGEAALIALSKEIAKQKKKYYGALASCNHSIQIDTWMHFFCLVIVKSQEEALAQIAFLIEKSKIMNNLHGKVNTRQEKVLLRMFQEGPSGFAGGLSADNYMSIAKTSSATATRDLNQLIELGALYKTGQLRHTRYWLS